MKEMEESTQSGIIEPKEFKIQEDNGDDQQDQIYQKSLVNQSITVKVTTGFTD